MLSDFLQGAIGYLVNFLNADAGTGSRLMDRRQDLREWGTIDDPHGRIMHERSKVFPGFGGLLLKANEFLEPKINHYRHHATSRKRAGILLPHRKPHAHATTKSSSRSSMRQAA
jgi:hypothetical protein